MSISTTWGRHAGMSTTGSSAEAQAQMQLCRGALLISSVRYLRNVALSSTMATFVVKSRSILCANCAGMSSMFDDKDKPLPVIWYPSFVVSVFVGNVAGSAGHGQWHANFHNRAATHAGFHLRRFRVAHNVVQHFFDGHQQFMPQSTFQCDLRESDRNFEATGDAGVR